MKAAALGILFLMPATAQYTARRAGEVIQLEDRARSTVVSIVPAVGNIAFEMKVKGKNVFWFPFSSVEEFRKKPALCGNPLLAPWANRLDENGFYANGKKYVLNLGLGNVRLDGFQHPIHGLLLFASDWQVTELESNDGGAWVSCRLDFSRRPDWMAQFPFAHTIQMVYTLRDGALQVQTRVENNSSDRMPLSLGFHPYYQITDAPRDDWTVGLPVRSQWVLSKELIPTGETRPVRDVIATPESVSLRGMSLDHVFGDLEQDATFWVKGKSQKIEITYGSKYPVAVVYAPTGQNRDFICFEPMTGITNAFNLAHRGVYKGLQSIGPGQAWQESFWVRPSGF